MQYIQIEELSAIALTVAWLVAAAIAGALGDEWFAQAREAQRLSPAFGVVRSLTKSWLLAVPLAEVGKALAVAAVILPVGGWLAFDLPTAVTDLGGMLVTVTLWRTALLRILAV